MVSIVRNLTIDMRVSISRNLNEDFTNVTVDAYFLILWIDKFTLV